MEKTDSTESALRVARHNLRGRLNALKLCISALEILDNSKERLEFLAMIEQSADALLVAMDRFDTAIDQTPTQSNI